MEGFVAVEQRPMVTKELGASGGTLTTEYDTNIEATIPAGTLSRQASLVTMMVYIDVFALHLNIIVLF